MEKEKKGYVFFSHGAQLLPQEEKLEVRRGKNHLVIGIPKESTYQENRVALAPEAVAVLVQNGHKVIIESKAGENAFFPDRDFAEAGGEIVSSPEEVFKAQLILKVAPLSLGELDHIKPGQVLFTALALSTQKEAYFKTLMEKRATAIAFEYIRDKTLAFPLVRSMSEIAGNTSVLIASEYLAHKEYGKGRMFGGFPGITPTEVIILGAGTVGEYAVRAAMGLGAMVKVFDGSVYKLRRLQNSINAPLFTSVLQPKVLLKALKTADVLIAAMHTPIGRSPVVVTEEMVSRMKYGSVIVDVSIDQGGCVETSRATSHDQPVFSLHGVTHYCVPNIASRVPHTASYAFSNFFTSILLSSSERGSLEQMLKTDAGLRHGIYLFNGTLTKRHIGEGYGLPHQDLDLLLAAF